MTEIVVDEAIVRQHERRVLAHELVHLERGRVNGRGPRRAAEDVLVHGLAGPRGASANENFAMRRSGSGLSRLSV
jgi:hypothetical protein